MSDKQPKSAVELAMARLQASDEEHGVDSITLSDEQKSDIAEARSIYEAKIAEQQIIHQSKLAITTDPDARSQLEEQHQRDVSRAANDRDQKIASIYKTNT